MNYTNMWLSGLSLCLAYLGHARSDHYALTIGLLCAFCVALAAILLPKSTPNTTSAIFLFLHRLWGWGLILFMGGGVADYATNGLSTELLTFAWRFLV